MPSAEARLEVCPVLAQTSYRSSAEGVSREQLTWSS
jgi:hypothetical protein